MAFFPVPRSPRPRTPRAGCGECRQTDEAEIRICGVVVSMTRRSNLDVPAEFSAFIPRAEIRRHFQDGRLSDEEIILSSITIVHSPRHRTEKESGAGSRVHGPTAVTVSPVPEADGFPAAPRPARQWDDQGTWSGVKVAAAERCVPRVTINDGVKSCRKDADDEAG